MKIYKEKVIIFNFLRYKYEQKVKLKFQTNHIIYIKKIIIFYEIIFGYDIYLNVQNLTINKIFMYVKYKIYIQLFF